MKEILNAAIEYLSLGWSVIPTGADKRPVCKWEQFQTAPAAMDRVEAWFKPESRNNIAICTGALSNIVVVDADSTEAIARLEKYLGEPPKTVQAKTPRGMHYYFRHPGIEMRNSVSLFQGVDFRGDGGYVIAPPSINEDGEMYEWVNHPVEITMQELPPRILERMRSDHKERKAEAAAPTTTTDIDRSAYGRMALTSEIETILAAPVGTRNHTFNASAFSLFQLVAGHELLESDVVSALEQAALSIGLEQKEISATIRSAKRAGGGKPRTAPPLPESKPAFDIAAPGSTLPDKPVPEPAATPDYFVSNNCIFANLWNASKEKFIKKQVIAVSAQIVEEIKSEEGEITFRVEGETQAGRRFHFEISAEEFTEDRTLKARLTNAAGSRAYVKSGMQGHLGAAIMYLSDPEVLEERMRYERTGWIGEGANAKFLIEGRDIGANEMALHKNLPYEFTKAADLATGQAALRSLLQSQPMDASTIVISTFFAAPMALHAGWRNERTGVFITGRTGSLKSSFCGAAMCLFGPTFLNDQNWISWGDTVNAIMAMCCQAQDVPILIDNYKPIVHAGGREMVRLIHSVFEGGEKRRLNRASKFMQHRNTYTWPIITGEDVPDIDAATLARVLIVKFPIALVDNKNFITHAQENSHHLNAVGGAWVDWLTTPEGQAACEYAKDCFPRYRARYSNRLFEQNKQMVNIQRVATNLAINQMAWEAMGKCPALAEIVSDFNVYHDAGIISVGEDMGVRTAETLEANRFLNCLGDILASERYILAQRWNSTPTGAPDALLGWQDEQKIYLLMTPALRAIEQYLGREGRIQVSDRTLYMQLDGIGAIAERGEGGRSTKNVRVGNTDNKAVRVLVLHRAALWPEDENAGGK
jgi:hypothetical protein